MISVFKFGLGSIAVLIVYHFVSNFFDNSFVNKQNSQPYLDTHCEDKSNPNCKMSAAWKTFTNIYQFSVKNIDNEMVNLEKYKGKVLLVVNVASKCGLTKSNYNELNELYSKHKDKGLEILAFPCNQFGGQEPGCDVDIKEFMKAHKVEFDVFAKINVNGDNAEPLYQWLKSKTPTGVLDKITGSWIKWNFTKFLVNRQGIPVERYGPQTNPLSFEKDLIKELETNSS